MRQLVHPGQPMLDSLTVSAQTSVLLRFIRVNSAGLLGLAILSAIAIAAIFASLISPHDPRAIDWTFAYRGPVWMETGTRDRILGGDALGRDVLSRLVYGSRVSLLVGSGGIGIALALGVSIGLIAGVRGGLVDNLTMRIADVFLSLPYLLFVMVVIGVLGPNLINVIVVFGVSDFPLFARITRGEVLRLKARSFVEAARALGASETWVVARHIFPNLIGVLVVVATFEMAAMMLYEAGLGFLGLSVPPTIPSWGNMLADGRQYLTTFWWLPTFPGLAILFTSLGVYLVGDWLRDKLDPRLPQL